MPCKLEAQCPTGRAALAATALVVACIAGGGAATAGPRAQGTRQALVPLATIDPSIVQDMRYATAQNFTGRPVPGYEAPQCWLRRAAAEALARVQTDLAKAEPPLSLKVFDCYRPQRAVRSFMRWAAGAEDGATRHYYPDITRSALIPKGYIARASTHSRGIAVDLTLVERPAASGGAGGTPGSGDTEPCTRTTPPRGEIDMGTAFDCFDAKSHMHADGLTAEQRRARKILRSAMARHGFVGYPREWWHYTYSAADDGQSFDVPVR